MMINGLWNRRCGPGGGTRRLHQYVWGRNRIDVRNKDMSFIRHGTVVIGLKTISATEMYVREEEVATVGAKAKAGVTTLVGSMKMVSKSTVINFVMPQACAQQDLFTASAVAA